MPWLKRNLFLVVGGGIALALLGFAVYFLLAKIQADRAVGETLTAQTDLLKSLVNRDPHPNPDNIAAAKEDQKKLQAFALEMSKHFAPAAYPTQLTSSEFGLLLESTVNSLRETAERAGVEIPTNYWFTFEKQKSALQFDKESLLPLAASLAEVKSICDILFQAKVNSLVAVKRSAAPKEETLGSQDYLADKPVTNEWVVATPYEITFHCFSAELARVLSGFVKAPQCVVVKNLVAEPAPATGTIDPSTMPAYPMMPNRYGMDPGLASRYGLGGGRGGGGRYGSAPTVVIPPPVMRAPVRSGATNLLDEKALKFTLTIDVVKLKPAGSRGQAAPTAAVADPAAGDAGVVPQ